MQGRLGRYFALGTTSGKRGYYFASQVSNGEGILGAVVVKVSLDEIERGWAASKEDDVIVTDPHGVIFISSRSEEHTSELQSLMRISYAVFCLKKKKQETTNQKYKKQRIE